MSDPSIAFGRRAIADPSVLVLALTTFAVGLSEFIVIGLMGQITRDLGASLSSGSWLVAAYALGISVGAPLLTFLSLGLPARRLSVLLIGGFAALSLGCALAPTMGWMIAFRALAGALHGAFFTVTTASLPSLFDEKRAPMALALMFSGLTVAMVLGVPLGMALAGAFGWQLPFILIALCAAAGAALLPQVLPQDFGQSQTPRIGLLRQAALRADLLWPYGFTIFGFGGGFAFFTYAEAWLTSHAGLSASVAGGMLGLVGLGALAGNVLGGALPQVLGRPRALLLAVAAQLLGLALLPMASGIAVIALALLSWSMGAFASAPMVHGWAIEISRETNARIAASLNVTAFNIGLSVSAMIAGRQLAAGAGLQSLPLTALILVAPALAIALGVAATARTR